MRHNARSSSSRDLVWTAIAGAILSGGTADLHGAPYDVPSRTKPARAAEVQRWAAGLAKAYDHLPLVFEKNEGQTDPEAQFVARTPGATVYLTASGAVMQLSPSLASGRKSGPAKPLEFSVVRMRLVRSNSSPTVEGLERLPGISNYFIGSDPRKWHTNVPQYAKARYRNVYSGVDLVYYGEGGRMEYDFVVGPGADPNAIRVAYDGADRMRLASNGDLVLDLPGGELRQRPPLVYQLVNDKRIAVASRYQLLPDNEVRFALAHYDRRRPLIIDPILVYATYLGGSAKDTVLGIAVDGSGNAYVAGGTQSLNFPVVTGSYRTNKPVGTTGVVNAFVSKFANSGVAVNNAALIYSTYLGGSGSYPNGEAPGDQAQAIALDSLGDACVTGFTNSPDFPVKNAIQPNRAGPDDAFITKLNSSGNGLVFSTYLGGSTSTSLSDNDAYQDGGLWIATDPSDNLYVLGETNSTNFPVTPGLYQSSLAGTHNFFVAKLTPGGAKTYATLVGGEGQDTIAARLKVDSIGEPYFVGYSTSQHYPTTSQAYQRTAPGPQSVVVTKLNNTFTGLLYSTYLGRGTEGTQNVVDPIFGTDIAMALDSAGNILVAGQTASNNFPVTDGSSNTVGTTIYSSLGTVNPNQGYAVGLYQGNGTVYADAAAFTPSSALTVHQIQAALSVSTIANAGSHMIMTLNSDSGGAPGAVLDQWDLTGMLSSTPAVVTLLSQRHPVLTANRQYWLVASMSDDSSTGVWYTNQSVTGIVSANVNHGGFNSSGSASPFYDFAVSTQGNRFFLTELNPNLSGAASLAFSKWIGGSGFDFVHGLAVDNQNNIYVTGGATSTDLPNPSINPPSTPPGGLNAFVMKFRNTDQALLFTTYFGGSGNQTAGDIAVGSNYGIYFGGNATQAVNFPSTKSTISLPFGGGAGDGFVAELAQANLTAKLSLFTSSTSSFNETAMLAGGHRMYPHQSGGNLGVGLGAGNNGSGGASGSGGSGGNNTGCDPNGAGATAENTTATYTYPPNQLTFANCSGAQSCVSSPPGTLVVTLGPIVCGMTSNVTVNFTVGSNLPSGTQIPVSVVVRSDTNSTDYSLNHDAITISIQAPPVISSLSQTSATAGSGQFMLTVLGSNFTGNSVVLWNGSPVAGQQTQVINTTTLQQIIPASLIANAGTATVTVKDGSLTSNGVSFAVTSPGGGGGGGGSTAPTSVLPSSGSAMSSLFTFTFADPNGWQDLDVLNVLINFGLDGRNACYLAYSRSATTLYLVANDGATLLALPVNGSGAVSNNQCSVTGAGTSASGSGNNLTLIVNLAFTASYAGNKVVYTAARDLHGGNSGWQALGVWNVPGASMFPSVASITPARGSGLNQTFTFTFNDSKGTQDLGVLNVLVNNFLDGRQACYIAYSQPSRVLYLVNDAGGGLSNGLTLGGSGSVSNSQCTINAAGSSVTTNGNNLILALNITFTAAIDGNRVVYAAARDSTDANNSTWQPMGTWTVQ